MRGHVLLEDMSGNFTGLRYMIGPVLPKDLI